MYVFPLHKRQRTFEAAVDEAVPQSIAPSQPVEDTVDQDDSLPSQPVVRVTDHDVLYLSLLLPVYNFEHFKWLQAQCVHC